MSIDIDLLQRSRSYIEWMVAFVYKLRVLRFAVLRIQGAVIRSIPKGAVRAPLKRPMKAIGMEVEKQTMSEKILNAPPVFPVFHGLPLSLETGSPSSPSVGQ